MRVGVRQLQALQVRYINTQFVVYSTFRMNNAKTASRVRFRAILTGTESVMNGLDCNAFLN